MTICSEGDVITPEHAYVDILNTAVIWLITRRWYFRDTGITTKRIHSNILFIYQSTALYRKDADAQFCMITAMLL